ncbi:MAG: hypothetical protein JW795_01615 [Chitinivibrionales bacterium]|nr:hypothetical protein [Chitinivibrionales bacterium]
MRPKAEISTRFSIILTLLCLITTVSPLLSQTDISSGTLAGNEYYFVNKPGAPIDSQRMSFDIKNTDIASVITMISKTFTIPIRLDSQVTGKVTLRLHDTPVPAGLKFLAEAIGCYITDFEKGYIIKKPSVEPKMSIHVENDTLDIDVANLDIYDFINEIRVQSSRRIDVDSTIRGKITGKLFNVSLDDGLNALLKSNGFVLSKFNDVFQVSQEHDTSSTVTPLRYSGALRASGRSGNAFMVECVNGMLSIDVINAQLDDIINAISEQTDVETIIYGRLLGEPINAKLNKVPLIEGLALLLSGSPYTFVQKNNVILFGNRASIMPSGQTLSKSELVSLRYLKADIIPSILPKNIPINNIKVIKEHNALLISGTSEDIVATLEFVKTVDVPTPQVLIDVMIVEYSRLIDKDFSFEVKGNMTEKQKGGNSFSFPYLEINRQGAKAKDFLKGILSFVNMSTAMIDKLPDDFYMVLRLLEKEGKAKLLAHPSITVLNGNNARIDVGETNYFQVRGGTAEVPTWDFKPINTGIILNITPWISKSGQITVEITPEISNVLRINPESKYPDVSHRSCLTTVCIDNDKTLVLGGLLRSEEKLSHYKVPFLGDLPFIGALFRSNATLKDQTNLVIYITPHIINQTGYVNLDDEMKKFNINERDAVFEEKYERTNGDTISNSGKKAPR